MSEKYILPDIKDYNTLEVFLQYGGYKIVKESFRKKPEDITDELIKSNLQFRNGSMKVVGKEFEKFRKFGGAEKILCIKGYTAGPGMIQNRGIIDINPHLLIEGALISAYITGAERVYFLVGSDEGAAPAIMQKALNEAKMSGFTGRHMRSSFFNDFACQVELHLCPPPHLNGENFAVIAGMESRRAYPVQKEYGGNFDKLWGRDVYFADFETICNIPVILEKGWKWFTGVGDKDFPGNILFPVTGKVSNKGLYELPSGSPLRNLITLSGGALNDIEYIFISGIFSSPLSGNVIDNLTLTPAALEKAGSRLLPAAVIFPGKISLTESAAAIINYYCSSNCGFCAPCREGNLWLKEKIENIKPDGNDGDNYEKIISAAENMSILSACSFGDEGGKVIADIFRQIYRGN